MKKLIFVIFIVCCTEVNSQSADANIIFKSTGAKSMDLKDTSNICTITMNSRSVYEDVQMFNLIDSTVGFLKDKKSGKLNVADIRTIKFKAKGFWKGALYGTGAGFLTGFVIRVTGGLKLESDGSNDGSIGQGFAVGVILAVPVGLIGGGIGSLIAEDHLYDMSDYSYIKKRSMIYHLIKEYPDW